MQESTEKNLLRMIVLYSSAVLLYTLWNYSLTHSHTHSLTSTPSLLLLASFLTASLITGLLNLLCFVPMLARLLLRTTQSLHQHSTSDIPGNPHAFDNSIISLMRTLPEPCNFNICYTGMSYMKPFVMEGAIPPAAINSISLYSRATSEPPVTLDISTLKSKSGNRFKAVFAPSSTPESELKSLVEEGDVGLLKYPDHWSGGFLAMRNFAVQNGTRVITPSVLAADGSVLRPPTSLVSGVTATREMDANKVIRVIIFNVLMFKLVSNLCHETWPAAQRIILLGGLVMGYLLYDLLFFLGKRGLDKHISLICPHMHEFRQPNDGEAADASQPSKEHRYWLMRFDFESLMGDDILVSASMRSEGQKYWSLSLYDEYGIPIPQYANVFNTTYCPNDDGTFNIKIRLTLSPKEPMIHTDNSSTASATIDMSKAPVGYAIFRIVHPTMKDTEVFSAPVASLIKPE